MPMHMPTSDPPLTDGTGFTLTVTIALFTQLFTSVPVTVYVVVDVGPAVTLAPVVAESEDAGDHV